MKVIAINGSPKANGNTALAIRKVTDTLNTEGIETETIHIGKMPLRGCIACGACSKLGRCAIDDGLNEIAAKMREADGIVIGSPVYYAGVNGTLKSFLDRVFYQSGGAFRFKPGAAVLAVRRGGALDAYHTINNYFGISQMIQVPANYWNMVYGRLPGEAEQDLEGMNTMEVIGKNMAYLVKMQHESSVPVPEPVPKVMFSYIR